MRPNGYSEERVWWFAGLVAVATLIAMSLLLSFRHSVDQLQPRQANQAIGGGIGLTRVGHTSESNIVAVEAKFFDPTPLFLPTEWNSDQNVLPTSILRDPGQMFQDFPSRLVFVDEGLRLKFPEIVQIPNKPVDTFPILDTYASYSGIGRGGETLAVLSDRGGVIEVTRADSGEKALAEALPKMALPAGNWHPLELLGVVDPAGLVGQLSLVKSSGVDEIDATIRDYLVESVHLGERLAPGFYRILVGP